MKRTRSPSGNGPDHPKLPRKHTEYKSDRGKLRPTIKTQVAPLNLCPFSSLLITILPMTRRCAVIQITGI